MSPRSLVIAVLTAVVSILPPLYLRLVWLKVPDLVATHSTGGVPDQFVGRQLLSEIVWWPLLLFTVLTFWPQVHEGQSLFWNNPRQRQLRALLVGVTAVCIIGLIYRNVLLGIELKCTSYAFP